MNLLVRPMEIVSKASKTDRDELFNKNYKKKYDPSILICICQLLVNFLLSFPLTIHFTPPLLSHTYKPLASTYEIYVLLLYGVKSGPMDPCNARKACKWPCKWLCKGYSGWWKYQSLLLQQVNSKHPQRTRGVYQGQTDWPLPSNHCQWEESAFNWS